MTINRTILFQKILLINRHSRIFQFIINALNNVYHDDKQDYTLSKNPPYQPAQSNFSIHPKTFSAHSKNQTVHQIRHQLKNASEKIESQHYPRYSKPDNHQISASEPYSESESV
nr:MAG TPA: hypothetical protein [Inoviridae sp.]